MAGYFYKQIAADMGAATEDDGLLRLFWNVNECVALSAIGLGAAATDPYAFLNYEVWPYADYPRSAKFRWLAAVLRAGSPPSSVTVATTEFTTTSQAGVGRIAAVIDDDARVRFDFYIDDELFGQLGYPTINKSSSILYYADAYVSSHSYDNPTIYGKARCYQNWTTVTDARDTSITWPWDNEAELDDWTGVVDDVEVAGGQLTTAWPIIYREGGYVYFREQWLDEEGLRRGTMLYRDSTGVLWRADSTGAAITVQYLVAAPKTWSSPVTVASGDYAQPGIWDGGDGYLYLGAFNNGDSKKYQWRRTGGLATWTADGEIT